MNEEPITTFTSSIYDSDDNEISATCQCGSPGFVVIGINWYTVKCEKCLRESRLNNLCDKIKEIKEQW